MNFSIRNHISRNISLILLSFALSLSVGHICYGALASTESAVEVNYSTHFATKEDIFKDELKSLFDGNNPLTHLYSAWNPNLLNTQIESAVQMLSQETDVFYKERNPRLSPFNQLKNPSSQVHYKIGRDDCGRTIALKIKNGWPELKNCLYEAAQAYVEGRLEKVAPENTQWLNDAIKYSKGASVKDDQRPFRKKVFLPNSIYIMGYKEEEVDEDDDEQHSKIRVITVYDQTKYSETNAPFLARDISLQRLNKHDRFRLYTTWHNQGGEEALIGSSDYFNKCYPIEVNGIEYTRLEDLPHTAFLTGDEACDLHEIMQQSLADGNKNTARIFELLKEAYLKKTLKRSAVAASASSAPALLTD